MTPTPPLFPPRVAFRQHELKEEAEARYHARAQAVRDRKAGATAMLEAEERARETAREEDQTAGPWGFVDGVRDGIHHPDGGEEGSDRHNVPSAGTRELRRGAQDGLGVFGLNVDDGEFHGLGGEGNKAGVGDAEVQLFQPLQQAAHEERCVNKARARSLTGDQKYFALLIIQIALKRCAKVGMFLDEDG